MFSNKMNTDTLVGSFIHQHIKFKVSASCFDVPYWHSCKTVTSADLQKKRWFLHLLWWIHTPIRSPTNLYFHWLLWERRHTHIHWKIHNHNHSDYFYLEQGIKHCQKVNLLQQICGTKPDNDFRDIVLMRLQGHLVKNRLIDLY